MYIYWEKEREKRKKDDITREHLKMVDVHSYTVTHL